MEPKKSRPITELLRACQNGEAEAWNELAEAVHEDLVKIAKRKIGLDRKNHTLEAADLVGELFQRLLKGKKVTFEDRSHFYRLCATKMSYILIDWARKRKTRIGDTGNIAPEEEAHEQGNSGSEKLLQIREALTLFREENRRAAEVMEMRYWLGLENKQIAEIIQKHPKTVETDLKAAKAFMEEYFRNNALR